ncbi:MAG: hypothetical protein R2844_16890 [Caldilineales bacterium]
MKNIKKWLAAAGAGLAVIAMTAVAMPAGTVSAASAQHGRGPGGQTDTYLAEALGVTVDELTSAYTAAREAAIDQAVADGTLTQEQADALKSGAGRIDGRGPGPVGLDRDAQEALVADQLGITVDELQTARTEANDARLADAVAAGEITQEQADAMQAEQALRDYLNQDDVQAQLQAAYTSVVQGAVDAGVITQEQADTILSNMENGFGRFGEMPGFGGRHGGPRGFGGPGAPPANGQQSQNDAVPSGLSF